MKKRGKKISQKPAFIIAKEISFLIEKIRDSDFIKNNPTTLNELLSINEIKRWQSILLVK